MPIDGSVRRGIPRCRHCSDQSAVQRSKSESAVTTAPATNITTSIILNVTNPQGLEDFVALTSTPGSPQYHRFLNVNQFVQRFAPSNRQIKQFEQYLESYGITIDKVYADNLDITVTGTAAQLNAAFATQLRDYTRNGQSFHRPAWKFVLPGQLAALVLSVPGLSNEVGDLHPKNIHLVRAQTPPATRLRSHGRRAEPRPACLQDYTVGDTANFYDFNPLYRQGILGRGQTIGIMTLANFNQADVYAYWQDIGLQVKRTASPWCRWTVARRWQPGVGDNETSLDVEQSGGLAPQAKHPRLRRTQHPAGASSTCSIPPRRTT